MRILIADDHSVVRQGLRSLIDKQPDMEVVAEAEDGRKAVDLAKTLSPDVVIMDITMPKLNGVDATRQILHHNPNIKILILSMHRNRHMVREVIDAGASGYVLKSSLLDEIAKALEVVQAGECYLSPRVAGDLVDVLRGSAGPGAVTSAERLTSRERQIIQLVAEGKTTKQIARELHLSPKTADAYRRRLMEKLAIPSVAELTKFAIREGLTSLDS